MPTIQEVRAKFPQYNDLSDDELGQALHQKFYADMPEADFRKRIGLATTKPTEGGFAPREAREAEPTREQMKGAYREEARGIRDRQSTVGKYLDTAGRGLARAIPFADDMAAGMDYLTGNAESFQDAKDRQEAMSTVDDTDRPVTSYGSQIVGGAGLPGGGALRSGSLGARMLKGAGIGAGYGALYGAGQGDDLGERAENAIHGGIVGGVTGGAIPAVTAGVGAAAGAAKRTFIDPIRGVANPAAVAQERVGRAIARDAANGSERIDPADFGTARANGQDPRVVDAGGENARALLRSSANTSPDAREQAASTLADRFNSQGERTADFIEGLPSRLAGQSPEDVRDALRARARQENATRYQRAEQEGQTLANQLPDGLWTPELDRLSQSDLVRDAINRSISTGTNEATVQGMRAARPRSPFEVGPNGELRVSQALDPVTGQRTLPSLQFWDQVQRNLRDVAENARRQGNNELSRQATVLRQQLNGHLDQLVPSFQDARQGAARYFGADDALEAGENFFTQKGRQDLAEAQRAFAGMSPAEQELFQHGYSAAAAHAARSTADNSNITGRPMFNTAVGRAKNQIGLGPQNAAATEAQVLRERIMDRARTALGNSTTARQLVEMGMAGGVGNGLLTGDWSPGNLATGAGVGMAAGHMLRTKVAPAIDRRVSNEVMQILMSDDPNVLNRVIQQSQAPQAVMAALRRIESIVQRGAPAAEGNSLGDQDTSQDIVIHPKKHAEGGSVGFPEQLVGAIADRLASGGQPQDDLVKAVEGFEKQRKVMTGLQALPKRRGTPKHFAGGGTVKKAVGALSRVLGREAPELGQTVTSPIRNANPGIYKDPRDIAAEAAAMVAPEHPAMKELFGVTRDDLYQMSKDRVGNADPVLRTKPNARGNANAQNVMNPQNEQRLIDALGEAEKYPELTQPMDAWYTMDPMYWQFVKEFGPEEAKRRYARFNTITSMASPGSDVETEINRGTAAHMMAQKGRFDEFQKFGGMAAANRGGDFPPELRDVIGHPYHSTSHAGPMGSYLESGTVDMGSPKVPLYMQSSGVPETGFQTELPVPDAHFTRATGLPDVRTAQDYNVSMKMPEFTTLGPWWRDKIASPLGLTSVQSQGRAWGLFSPQTGVDTAIGAPKLELFSKRIWDRAQKLGIDPALLRDQLIRGEQHSEADAPQESMTG